MPTILYAEDDRDCRELFAYVLRQKDYHVYEAINGAQAVQIVRDEPIDLVILDVRMPMMTGYDAARMIGKEAPHIPIMFLSAKGLQREVQKAFDCGPMVVDYLVKPVTPDQLVWRVDEILKVARTQGLEAVRQQSLAREELAYVRH
jgi:two-component system OmpR family response regulator